MNYAYNNCSGHLKVLYKDIDGIRMDHGLVKLVRIAVEGDIEYDYNDPFVTIAIIRLGEGERLVREL